MSYLGGLAGFDTFIPVAQSASCTSGVAMVYAGFLSAMKNSVQSVKTSFVVVSP